MNPVIAADPLAAWRRPRIAVASPDEAGHAILAYFNVCPESPDGSRVLFYASDRPDADHGELVVVDRASGARRVVARVAKVEDAHRAACQQWSDGGRSVVWHDCRDGRWVVLAAPADGGPERVLAADRQLGFGCPTDHRVPLYGCHWNPGEHRDLEFADVRGGGVTTAVPIATVVAAYRDWVQREFASEEVSVFFPVVSPTGDRVFFKLARGRGGSDFTGMDASHRQGLVAWDLAVGKPLYRSEHWGHPSWSPDGAGIFEKGNVLTRLADGSTRRSVEGGPSDHPTLSPDGSLFVTDGKVLPRDGGRPDEWGIFVGSTTRSEYVIVHRFINTGGASSWRRCHPHPAFSADGRRIWFNINAGRWTRLHVAEAAG